MQEPDRVVEKAILPVTEAAARSLTEAAARSLTEAAARRAALATAPPPKELQGRDGPDPVRYGDWEVNGRAVDF